MGWIVAEEMGRRFGMRESEDSAGLIWAIKFSEEWYRLHMPPLKKGFEDGDYAIGRDEEHLTDLRSVREIRGVARVPPIRTGDKGLRRHGDYAIALALADFASRMRWIDYAYRGTGAVASPLPSADTAEAADERDGISRAWWRTPLGTNVRGGL